MKNYFVLFACCIPVKGHSRSTICDLQRNTFDLIPNVLYEILTEHPHQSIQEIFAVYDNQYNEEIQEYIEFLVSKEYGFYSNTPLNFPKISLHWQTPFSITNALIDFDEQSTHQLSTIIPQLSALYCPTIELRFFYAPAITTLIENLELFKDTAFRCIQLIIGYHHDFSSENLAKLLRQNPRIQNITVHSTPASSITPKMHSKNIVFTNQKITSEACCGNISPYYFTTNISTFTEAQHFNSCLNRKIGIDKRGYIKNCPSMNKNFGHIDNIPLKQVVENASFQKLWNVNKDQVLDCQDCEFRYICHDCRAYVADPNNELSKPAKCQYNPYEACWENQVMT